MSSEQQKYLAIAYERDLSIIETAFSNSKEHAIEIAKKGWIGVVVYRDGNLCVAEVYRDGVPENRLTIYENFYVYRNVEAILRKNVLDSEKICG